MQSRPRRGPFLVAVVASVLVVVAGAALARVQSVTCSFGAQPCPAEVVSSLHSLRGHHLLFSNTVATAQAALQPHSAYRVQAVQKIYPSTIEVTLESQSLLYQLKRPGSDEVLAASDQAAIITMPLQADLPTIVINDQLWYEWQAAGSVPPQVHQQLKDVSRALGEASLSPQGVVLEEVGTLVLYLPENQVAILDLPELRSDIARLVLILRELRERSIDQPIIEIDLRFRLPVLRGERTIPRHETL